MLADKLHAALADSYVLFAKTQNYHWNVRGCCFKSLHELFEEQYEDLYKAIDVLAEIIRTLGVDTKGTLKEYLEKTNLREASYGINAKEMLKDLLNDQMIIQATFNDALEAAKRANDEVVASFISDRLTAHKKNAWMLESSICSDED